jgi:hypothetical protein
VERCSGSPLPTENLFHHAVEILVLTHTLLELALPLLPEVILDEQLGVDVARRVDTAIDYRESGSISDGGHRETVDHAVGYNREAGTGSACHS